MSDIHPCAIEEGEFDHDWEFQDDSFDHEYGTEQIHYWQCTRCNATKNTEAGDYDYDEPN
jgi:hypothetical protein